MLLRRFARLGFALRWRSSSQSALCGAALLSLALLTVQAQAEPPPLAAASGTSVSVPSNEATPPPQSTAPPPSQPADEKTKAGQPLPKTVEGIAAGTVVGILGKKVRDPAGEDMGMVVDVLIDGDGRPVAAVIDFGGFLGVGTRKIAVDWRLLRFTPADPDAPVLLSLGRAEVQAAPEYKPSSNADQPAWMVGPPPAASEGARGSSNAER
jgi:hypothetical protein